MWLDRIVFVNIGSHSALRLHQSAMSCSHLGAEQFIQLLQDMVYGTVLGGAMNVAVQARKSAEEVVGYQAVQERSSEIVTSLNGETEAASANAARQAAGSGSTTAARRDSCT